MIQAEMRGQGLFGISIPVEYGGLGLTMSEEAGIVRELGRASLAFRSVTSVEFLEWGSRRP
jgi:acyl-CoA dehydrogenase